MPRNTPSFLESSLQGLAYWIGFKKSFYGKEKITEFAASSQLLDLLYAKKKDNMKIECEIMHKKICNNIDENYNVTNKSRVDIAIIETKQGDSNQYKYFFELKRYGAQNILIENDIRRLKWIKNNTNINSERCFLILISENQIPGQYVNIAGNSDRKKYITIVENNTNIESTAIRVLKSGHSFDKIQKANYICLIEVL